MSIVQEKVTWQYPVCVISHYFSSATTKYSTAIDTSGYEDGVYFAMSGRLTGRAALPVFIDFSFEHSDQESSGYVSVDLGNLVYKKEAPLTYRLENLNASIQSMQGLPAIREGLVYTKRYVRVVATPVGSAVNTSYINVVAALNAELRPTPEVIDITY